MSASKSILTSVAVVTLGFCLVYMMARIMTLHRRIAQLECVQSENGATGHSIESINQLIRAQLEEAIRIALKDDATTPSPAGPLPPQPPVVPTKPPASVRFVDGGAAFIATPIGFPHAPSSHVATKKGRVIDMDDVGDDGGVQESKHNALDPIPEAAATEEKQNANDVPADPLPLQHTGSAPVADVFPRSTTDEGDGSFQPPPADVEETKKEDAPVKPPPKTSAKSGRGRRAVQ